MGSQAQVKDWRVELENWLNSGHSKIMPADLAELREEFVQRFPLETLSELTLDEYAIGKPDSFCYWLDSKTQEFGSSSRSSAYQWGIF